MSEPEQSASRPPQQPEASGEGGASDAELERLRAEIDRVDGELLAVLNRRAELVRRVGERKREQRTPVYSAARERDLVARLAAANPGPFPEAALPHVFREVISATRSLEQVLRVAYLGPEGTFSHEAARRVFGALAEFVPQATIPEVFAAVERGEADHGVVPVENTSEGVVTQTLDTFADAEVAICGEHLLPVAHVLLSQSGRREDVRRVASHPQPLAQCRAWLDRELPGTEREETASTAGAARRAAANPEVAAIASALCGELLGLRAIESGIQDRRQNTTRFLVIGGEPPPASGSDLTSAVFTVRKAQSGALHRLLEPFARHGVNLTSIHSRPLKGAPFEYLFFLEFEGHENEPRVTAALRDAAELASSQRVLGSFPRASRPREGAD